MKKVLLGLALVAFVGTSAVTAGSLGTDKEKTTKCDDKKSSKKSCCKKTEKSCCNKGDAKTPSCHKKEETK